VQIVAHEFFYGTVLGLVLNQTVVRPRSTSSWRTHFSEGLGGDAVLAGHLVTAPNRSPTAGGREDHPDGPLSELGRMPPLGADCCCRTDRLIDSGGGTLGSSRRNESPALVSAPVASRQWMGLSDHSDHGDNQKWEQGPWQAQPASR
jgi:hypothetical protein